MEHSLLLSLLLQVILIACNAVFSCAEIAVISMNNNHLAHLMEQGDRRAIRLGRLTSHPAKFLAVIQIAITLSGFLGSAFAADNFSGVLSALLPLSGDAADTVALILTTLILAYFTLVFGELVPKRIAMTRAESLALALSGLLSVLSKLFAPLVFLLSVTTNGIVRLMGIDPDSTPEENREEEIQLILEQGRKKGEFPQETSDFIQNVFAFDDRRVREFATPRENLALLWTNQSRAEWEDCVTATRHTRYPVCRGEYILGILDARDLFRLRGASVQELLDTALTPPFLVQGSMTADNLFRRMRESRIYYATVLDERGAFFGVVTMRDLLEQLVGRLDGKEPL